MNKDIDSILLDLKIISQYFPEYKEKVGSYFTLR